MADTDTEIEINTSEVETEGEGGETEGEQRPVRKPDLRVAEIAKKAIAAGYRLVDKWWLKEFVAFGVESVALSTGKPFANTPNGRINGRPALWVDVTAALATGDIEKAVRSSHQAWKALSATREAYAKSLEAQGVTEAGERKSRAFTEVEAPCVPLKAVLNQVQHHLRLATDPAYLKAHEMRDEHVLCAFKGAGCVGEVAIGDAVGFNIGTLRFLADERNDNEVQRKLGVGLLNFTKKRGENGLPPLVCRACGKEITPNLRGVLKPAVEVLASVFGYQARVAEEVGETESVLAALGERGITMNVNTENPQFKRDMRHGDGRGRGRGERNDGRGRGRNNDDQRGRRDRGNWSR